MSHPLFTLLKELDKAKYFYTLNRQREDAVRVDLTFVGERVEVDVFSDGHMEVSRFLGTEDILGGKEVIYDLIKKNLLNDKLYSEHYKNK